MAVESGTVIDDLNAAWPTANDFASEGDDHIRLIKQILQSQFPNFDAPLTVTPAELNDLTADLALKAVKTHFNDAGIVPQVLYNGVVCLVGTSGGVAARPSSQALDNYVLLSLQDISGDLKGYVGFPGTDNLYVRNNVAGGDVYLIALNADGVTSETYLLTQTATGSVVLQAKNAAGAPEQQLRTQAQDSGSNTTGANIQHRNGSYYDVGMNVSPRTTGATRSILATDAGTTIDMTAAGNLTIPTGLPAGMWVNVTTTAAGVNLIGGAGMTVRYNGKAVATPTIALQQNESYRVWIEDSNESWVTGAFADGNLAQSGYSYRADGLLEQWGRETSILGNRTTQINFPTTFPSACHNVTFTVVSSESGLTAEQTLNAQPSTSSFVIFNRANTTIGLHWRALGE